MANTIELAVINTEEEIQQYKEDKKATHCFCARCGLKKMMTIDELIAYTENCKLCRDRR